MNAEEFQLPPEVVAKIEDKCGRIDKVVKGIYYQFTKHKLTNYDCCVALSAVFNGIKSAQDDDGKTEMEMMFTSLIEQRPPVPIGEPSKN